MAHAGSAVVEPRGLGVIGGQVRGSISRGVISSRGVKSRLSTSLRTPFDCKAIGGQKSKAAT